MIAIRPKTQSIAMKKACELNCTHCQGHFLKNMADGPEISHDSFLLSGGCDIKGMVDIDFCLLKDLKKKNKLINIHTGIIDERHAKKIGRYADVVSFDFVSDDEIIKRHYASNLTEKDYVDSYKALKKHCAVVPHVMIGYGNETKSLKILKGLGTRRVVMLILMSTHGKFSNGLDEPSIRTIKDTLMFAREHFSHVTLGCMRPVRRKEEIDKIAMPYVDAIVNPHKSIPAEDHLVFEMCCALMKI